jgi:nucleolar protein 6
MSSHVHKSMVTPKKLTKKQKKSLAFRERKQGKSRDEHKDEDTGSPIMEDQDMVGCTEVQTMEWQAGADDMVAERKGESEDEEQRSDLDAQPDPAEVVAGRQKKRKRESESVRNDTVEVEGERPKRKKTKGVVGETGPTGSTKVKTVKQRFILFVGVCSPSFMLCFCLAHCYVAWVGNLKYTTSTEAIKEHFAVCGERSLIFGDTYVLIRL